MGAPEHRSLAESLGPQPSLAYWGPFTDKGREPGGISSDSSYQIQVTGFLAAWPCYSAEGFKSLYTSSRPTHTLKMPFGWDCRGDLKAGWLPRPISTQVLYGLKCSAKERSGATGRTAARRRAARASASSSGSSRAMLSISGWTGGKLCYAVQASQASTHIKHPIRQAASADSAPRSTGAAKRKWSGSKSSSYSGQSSNSRLIFYTNSSSLLPIPKKGQRSEVIQKLPSLRTSNAVTCYK